MNLIIAILATYRVAHMIVGGEGPFLVFMRFRSWFVNRYGMEHWTSKGLACVFCTSFWLAWIPAAFLPWEGWTMYFFNGLAIGGGVVVIHRWLYGD